MISKKDVLSPSDQTNDIQLKFRNYVPRLKELKEFCVSRQTVEDLEKKLEGGMHAAIEASLSQDVLAHVNPRKPNWDLKRDVLKKLSQLSKQTDSAILQLIQINIETNKQDPKAATLAAAAAATSTTNYHEQCNNSDSDDDDNST